MTYNIDFEKSLKHIGDWVKDPVVRKAVVYAGDFENTAGDINVVNFRHLNNIIE